MIPVMLTPILTLPSACAVNTAIGTLPWMAELTHQPKPVLRVVTFTVTLIIDMVIVLAPGDSVVYGKFYCVYRVDGFLGGCACDGL